MTDFFKDYKLDGDNKYDCSSCKTYTNATKSISVEQAPVNMIVSLKRFDKFGTKIKSCVEYPDTFKLSDFTQKSPKNEASDVNYELYAVINHEGRFSARGHYNWYVKGYDQNWYICDDSDISKIGKNTKKSTKAYILFYKLSDEDKYKKINNRKLSDASTCDVDSDGLSSKASKSKSKVKSSKPKQKVTQSNVARTRKRVMKRTTRSGSKVLNKPTRTCREQYSMKRRKVADLDYFNKTAEICIEIET